MAIKPEDLTIAHPKFKTWLGTLDAPTMAAVNAQADTLASDPDIAQNQPQGAYARLFKLMTWCQTNYGYSFT